VSRWTRLRPELWPPGWTTVSVLGFVLPVAFVVVLPASADNNFRTRLCGLIWQVLGITVVLWKLGITRVKFKRPTLRDTIRSRLTKLKALWAAPDTTLSASASGSGTSTADLTAVGVGAAPKTLQQRVSDLEREVSNLRTSLTNEQSERRVEIHRTKTAVHQEVVDRKAADSTLGELVADVAASTIHVERVGLAWLKLGVICTSVPEVGTWIASALRLIDPRTALL
jgi:hypothetical protein